MSERQAAPAEDRSASDELVTVQDLPRATVQDRPAARDRTVVDGDERGRDARGERADTGVGGGPAGALPGDAGRYVARRALGRGGVGEVTLCLDTVTGREVALKTLLPAQAGLAERFLREARVQAQLEHPGVVPVYDIGRTERGPFFTMKRVQGQTLEELLRGDIARARAVDLVATVCQTVAYAHQRGVIHRDLKPENVMVGRFGEVHVLDWGIAKVRDVETNLVGAPAQEHTLVGTLIGTPGYMPPEQARGVPVDARADVYALGAILFEVLVREALHPGRTLKAVLDHTLSDPDVSPAARAPAAAVPPELDWICRKALATDPSDRFRDADEMHRYLRRYLDGERDRELRASMAEVRVRAAEEALGRGEEDGALAALGAALGLDPQHARAREKILTILLDSSREPPPAVERELAREVQGAAARAAGRAAVLYAALLPAFALLVAMGVRQPGAFAVLIACIVVTGAMGLGVRFTGRLPRALVYASLVPAFGAVACSAAVFGPWVFPPAFACANAAAMSLALRADVAMRRAILVASVGGVAAPALGQWLAWLPRTMLWTDGQVRWHPWMITLDATLGPVLLAYVALVAVVLTNVLVGRTVEDLRRAERRRLAQALRLRSLLPDALAGAATGVGEAAP